MYNIKNYFPETMTKEIEINEVVLYCLFDTIRVANGLLFLYEELSSVF